MEVSSLAHPMVGLAFNSDCEECLAERREAGSVLSTLADRREAGSVLSTKNLTEAPGQHAQGGCHY